jgi:antibiotic biosynthesis monooxygenase (ABM) superfamily enzyme
MSAQERILRPGSRNQIRKRAALGRASNATRSSGPMKRRSEAWNHATRIFVIGFMADLKDKVQKVLSENRTLVLGAQILLGFQYQAVFRPKFEELPAFAKGLEILALALLLGTILCLIAPSSFHRISEGGESTGRLHAYAKHMITLALVPFSLALGANLVMTTERVLGFAMAVALGLGTVILTIFMWFGVPLMQRKPERPEQEQDEKVPLKEKINELLTESRIVLPGAQALLGFQLAAYLTEGFDKLSVTARMVHTGSLICIALTMILLMTPAPLHRLGENGENTKRFDRLGVAFVLTALVPLSLGLAGELYVVLEKTLQEPRLAWMGAGIFVVASMLLWFVVPLVSRSSARHGVSS